MKKLVNCQELHRCFGNFSKLAEQLFSANFMGLFLDVFDINHFPTRDFCDTFFEIFKWNCGFSINVSFNDSYILPDAYLDIFIFFTKEIFLTNGQIKMTSTKGRL